ncbi:MAG: 50S ribosomal protein L11 methyltransferase [Gammaproteobacteria bacterium]|nr:50S ribosomal protein L11 methyltransferase [Gammaproteobacteria bacterium]
MPWIQLTLQTDSKQFEQIEDAMMTAGALSVTASDNADQPILEPAPGETPIWDKVCVTGLFEEDTDIDTAISTIKHSLGVNDLPTLQKSILEDQEWTRAWMEHFKPMPFGKRLWVCPDGFTPPEPEAINMRLDPGLAFGTGTHPTTALCLEWLDSQALENTRVLDYGCGSGILAIAALLLGARSAYCVDNDPQALTATIDNAVKNEVETQVKTGLPDDLPAMQADICVANILAGPLKLLAPTLAQHTRPGGKLILSGILHDQAEDVRQHYQQWFDMSKAVFKEDWTRLQGVRK